MKAADLRLKTHDELIQLLRDLKRERLNLRFQQASGQLEKPSRMKEIRRDIARILTILNERKRSGGADKAA
ncbi:MAG: 50S ribosomal protein L29 [Alphaproteobacteria bacterium]|nr:MAG: 50S ribosomal protein L29 [Alphaproteobacteria bacterium]